jgi:hypothetical protein
VICAALLALALAVGLTACGGSSSGKSKTAAATTVPGGVARAPGSGSQSFAKLRECLHKNGIDLPKGVRGLGALVGPTGTPRNLPPGVSRSEFEGVMKKCGGAPLLRGGTRGFGGIRSPVFEAALKRFGACMRAAGVHLPEANTSGKGPIFDTSGLNPASPQFRKAAVKCSSELRGAFRRPPAATAPSG